jgi:hypothetical protein
MRLGRRVFLPTVPEGADFVQGLVDRIVDSIGGDSRVAKELSALQRIVNAAVIAMK